MNHFSNFGDQGETARFAYETGKEAMNNVPPTVILGRHYFSAEEVEIILHTMICELLKRDLLVPTEAEDPEKEDRDRQKMLDEFFPLPQPKIQLA